MKLTKLLRRLILFLIRRLPPAASLRWLLRLDRWLYYLQGQMAVAYGDGVHVKHRLIEYHDFFVNRIREEDRVLDIGCGIGALAHDIASRTGAKVVGIDINEASVHQARLRFPHPSVRYLVGDARGGLQEGDFDVVVLSNVLEHLPDRPGFLRGVQNRTGAGRWLVRVPLYEREWRVPLKKELGVEWRLDPTHEIEYTPDSFEKETAAAGLVIGHLEIRWGEIWAELFPIGTEPLHEQQPQG